MTDIVTASGSWAGRLLGEWDRQQALHRPYRESGVAVLVATARALLGGRPGTVLELGSGCGSVLARLRLALPDTRLLGADRDPVLMKIAAEVFRDDTGVQLVDTDLRDLATVCPPGTADVIVSCTTLHWLAEAELAAAYRAAYDLLAPGGAVINLDWMPAKSGEQYQTLAAAQLDEWSRTAEAQGALSWQQWWNLASEQPELHAEMQARSAAAFGRSAEFMPGYEWHESSLAAAGFTEVAEIWRAFDSAAVLALRR